MRCKSIVALMIGAAAQPAFAERAEGTLTLIAEAGPNLPFGSFGSAPAIAANGDVAFYAVPSSGPSVAAIYRAERGQTPVQLIGAQVFSGPYGTFGEPDIADDGRVAVRATPRLGSGQIYLLIDPDLGTTEELLRTGDTVTHWLLGSGTFSSGNRDPRVGTTGQITMPGFVTYPGLQPATGILRVGVNAEVVAQGGLGIQSDDFDVVSHLRSTINDAGDVAFQVDGGFSLAVNRQLLGVADEYAIMGHPGMNDLGEVAFGASTDDGRLVVHAYSQGSLARVHEIAGFGNHSDWVEINNNRTVAWAGYPAPSGAFSVLVSFAPHGGAPKVVMTTGDMFNGRVIQSFRFEPRGLSDADEIAVFAVLIHPVSGAITHAILVWSPLAPPPANRAPAVDPIADRTVTEGETLAFSATASDPDGDAVTFSLGAAAPAGASITPDGAFSFTPTADQGPGSYPISVIASDGELTGSQSFVVTVNAPPTASLSFTPPSPVAGDLVAFDGTGSADPEGGDLDYAWDFGDGEVGSGATPAHVYATAGTYDVVLVVTDPAGAMGMANQVLGVGAPPSPNRPPAVDALEDVTIHEGQVLTFTATAIDPDGDAVTFTLGAGAPAGATITPAGDFTWATSDADGPGVYTITIVASDGELYDDEELTVTVNAPPTAAFSITPESPAAGVPVGFDATASSDPEGAIAGLSWAFGDGVTASGAVVEHTYAAAGSYTVVLTVTDAAGATASTSRELVVAGAPAATLRRVFVESHNLRLGETQTLFGVVANQGDGPLLATIRYRVVPPAGDPVEVTSAPVTMAAGETLRGFPAVFVTTTPGTHDVEATLILDAAGAAGTDTTKFRVR